VSDGKNRTRPSSAIYRALMMVFETRRVELGLSMNTEVVGLNDLAGAADGFYAKMIYPDTPSGRQARWETVDEFATVLFGRDYVISIVPGDLNRKTLSAVSEPPHASSQSINIRHWRHSRHFKELGRKGGLARKDKLSPERRVAIAKKANRASRRARAAKRQGESHKAANAEKRAT
jgi:hypothetical protein